MVLIASYLADNETIDTSDYDLTPSVAEEDPIKEILRFILQLTESQDFLIICGLALIALFAILIMIVLCCTTTTKKSQINGYNRAATQVLIPYKALFVETIESGIHAIVFANNRKLRLIWINWAIIRPTITMGLA